jgi:hypothetical protein
MLTQSSRCITSRNNARKIHQWAKTQDTIIRATTAEKETLMRKASEITRSAKTCQRSELSSQARQSNSWRRDGAANCCWEKEGIMRRILYQEEGLGTELRVAFSLQRLLETKFVIQIHERDRH